MKRAIFLALAFAAVVVSVGIAAQPAAAVTNDTVYVGSGDNSTYALDAETGSEEWSYLTGGSVSSSPTVFNNTVYVGSSGNSIYALDAETGSKKWSHATGGSVFSSPTIVNGTVYVGSHDNSVYALDANTGSVDWSQSIGDVVASSPTVLNGTVYVGSHDNSVYALDANTGSVDWSQSVGGIVSSSPTVLNGTVYVGSYDNSVYALDAETGSQEWSYATGDTVYGAPTVSNGIVYVGSVDNSLYALDAETGSKEWSHATGGSIFSSPTLSGQTVYIGSNDNSVYALDANTGSVDWSQSVGGLVDSSPTVFDDTVYIGSDDNSLYALDANTGSEEWSYSTGDDVFSSPTAVRSGSSKSDGSRVLFRTLGHHSTWIEFSQGIVGTISAATATGSGVPNATVELYRYNSNADDLSEHTKIDQTETDNNGTFILQAPDDHSDRVFFYVTIGENSYYYPFNPLLTAPPRASQYVTDLPSPPSVDISLPVHGPVLSNPTPADGSTVGIQSINDPVNISVRVSDEDYPSDVTTVTFYEYDTGEPSQDPVIGTDKVFTPTAGQTERAEVEWSSATSSGTYAWYAVAESRFDTWNATGGAWTFNIDVAKPKITGVSPTTGTTVQSNSQTTVDFTVEDGDFPDDTVTVEVYEYGTGDPTQDTQISSSTYTSETDDSVSISVGATQAEAIYFYANDSYGNEYLSQVYVYRPAQQMTITDADAGSQTTITDRPVEIQLTYPQGTETITVNNGVLDFDDIVDKAGSQTIARIRAAGYYERVITFNDYGTEIVVPLNQCSDWQSNPSNDDPSNYCNASTDSRAVQVSFDLDDQTGNFQSDETKLLIREEINATGGDYQLVHSELFGAGNRVTVDLIKGRIYQLEVQSPDHSRTLGSYLATEDEVVTLTIGAVEYPLGDEKAYAIDAYFEEINNQDFIRVVYNDSTDTTDRLGITIYERSNKSNVLYQATAIDVSNHSWLVPISEAQRAKTWIVEYEGNRNGDEISGYVIVGELEDIPIPGSIVLLTSFALVGLTFIAALYSGPASIVGSVVLVGVAGVLILVGWLPMNPIFWVVAAAIAIGGYVRMANRRV